MAKFLIPGGAGYAGSRLTSHLIEKGAEKVFLTSRKLSDAKTKWIDSFKGKVVWRAFDTAKDSKLPFEEEVDALINLAMPPASEFSTKPDETTRAAVQSLEISVEYAKAKAQRLLHFSSFHIYGKEIAGTVTEETIPNPTHPYGKAHLAAEEYVRDSGLPIPFFILRPSNSIGRPAHSDLGVQKTLIFFDLCEQAVKNRKIELKTDGEGYRDFLPMRDFLSAVDCVLHTSPVPSHHATFNLSLGKTIRLRDLAKIILDEAECVTKTAVSMHLGTQKDGFGTPFTVSNYRLRELGWAPRGDLKTEVREIIESFLV